MHMRPPVLVSLFALGCTIVACTPVCPDARSAAAVDTDDDAPPTAGTRPKAGKKIAPEACDPKPGHKAPKLALTQVNGDHARVKIAPGKVTIVDFWATWCPPCEQSFPHYQALYVKYKDKGLDIVAVAVDDDRDDAALIAFAKRHGRAKFPIAWDDGHAVAQCWSPKTMPTAFVIDREGVVRHVHVKWEPGDERTLEREIKALL